MKKIEQLAFLIIVIGMALTTLNRYIEMSGIFIDLNLIIFLLGVIFYSPFLIIFKKSKDNTVTIPELITYQIISFSCCFYLISQITQSETISTIGSIMGIANFLMYFYYLTSEKSQKPLLIRHIVISLFIGSITF